MAGIILGTSDLALYADPGATLVTIPHLVAAPRNHRRELALVRFEGDTAPTAFRGEGSWREYELTCRYSHVEHTEMLALLTLLDTAHGAVDGRLQLRTNPSRVPGLSPFEVGVVGDVAEQNLSGMAFDVRFTFTAVNH